MPQQTAASMNLIININGKVIQSVTSGFVAQGLILTKNPILPTGNIQNFINYSEVYSYFGDTTNPSDTKGLYKDSVNADAYFKASSSKGTKKPNTVLFYRFTDEDTKAFTRGSRLSNTNLDELKLVEEGTLKLLFNGTTYNVNGINLTTATSFGDIASKIQTEVQKVTGITTATVTYDNTTGAFTITYPIFGQNYVNYVLDSADTLKDRLAQRMLITQSKGAILSQGTLAKTTAQIMDDITNITSNFITIIPNFDINTDPSYETIIDIIKWNDAQTNLYLPIFYDTIGGSTTPITAPMKQALINAGYGQSSVEPWTLSSTLMELITNEKNVTMPFSIAGIIASYRFNESNGIIQLNATKLAVGTPVVTTSSDLNLLMNKFSSNSYTNLNTRNNNFVWFEKGLIGGKYGWADTLVGYIWLADQCQVAIANLMQILNSVPYNQISVIDSMLYPIFLRGIANGVIQRNIELTSDQKYEIEQEAGYDISSMLYSAGFVILPIQVTADDISNRTLGNIKAFYTYAGGPVTINMTLNTVR